MKVGLSMPTPRKNCKRWNFANHAHALTFSCFQRQPLLNSDRAKQWMIDGIDHARSQHAFHLWAYVIMPEHVHMLIYPTQSEYSISAILNSMKQSVSKRALTFIKKNAPEFLTRMEHRRSDGRTSFRFWQRGGGYDRNLVEPQVVLRTVAYLHANPVRRGLCRGPMDWRWSSAAEWESPGVGPLKIDRETFPRVVAG